MLQFFLASLAVVWSLILLGAGVLAWHFYRHQRAARDGSGAESGRRAAVTPHIHSVSGRRGRRERKIVV